MKKHIILTVVAMITLIMASPASAWSVTSHHDIAEETYYSLPSNVQKNLNLSEMIDGSDDPDTKFMDFKYHVYPYNVKKAEYWLNQGKISYNSGNYNYSSYCYGVATHYISDGLAGPHFESGTSHVYHSLYEIRAMFLKAKITYYSGSLEYYYKNNHIKTEKSWESWVTEGDDSNIQNDLNRAGSASYSAVYNSIESK